jgi:hypothetical protein
MQGLGISLMAVKINERANSVFRLASELMLAHSSYFYATGTGDVKTHAIKPTRWVDRENRTEIDETKVYE